MVVQRAGGMCSGPLFGGVQSSRVCTPSSLLNIIGPVSLAGAGGRVRESLSLHLPTPTIYYASCCGPLFVVGVGIGETTVTSLHEISAISDQ